MGGGDAGALAPPFTFDAGFAACEPNLLPPPFAPDYDAVFVQGVAGRLGAVNYTHWGYSAGTSSQKGSQHFTNGAYQKRNTPPDFFDTGLWLWPNVPVVDNQEYVARNDNQYDPPPFIDFRLSAFPGGAYCPRGAGWGRINFSAFHFGISNHPPSEGTFAFECPDAGISVRGCFHYGTF